MNRITQLIVIYSLCLSISHTLYGVTEQHLKRVMKILVVTYTFPKVSETFVVNQITGLLSQGHDVSIYAQHPQPKHIFNEDVAKYDLISRTYYEKLPPDLNEYDAIICQFGMLGNTFLEIKKKYNLRAKLATFFRGFDISSRFHLDKHMYDKLFKQGDLLIANCEFFKKRLLKHGADPQKTLVYYSSIDCSKFPFSNHVLPNDGTVEIVTVARLAEKKGIEDALRAVHKVIKHHKKTHYTIIGDGPLKPQLQYLTKKLGITSQVTFAGWRTPSEIAQYLTKAHMFILPCVTAKNHDQDAITNTLKEAMACGLPVVSTYVGGVPEGVKDGINGFLVQEHDPKSLAKKMEYLIAHSELWHSFGAAGRALVEDKFEIKKQTIELEKILLNLTLPAMIR